MRSILERYAAAFRKIGAPVFLGVLPVVVLVWALVLEAHGGDVAVDFHHELYPEAKLILDGVDPYPPVDADLSYGTNTIWPVAAAVVVAPLTVLPAGAADWAMTAIVLACFAGALLVMGVRDWRIFGATALWPPVISAMQTANLTLPLCLLAALVWRFRERRIVAGVALGAGLALKFFLWPLLGWLVALRKHAAAAIAAAIALGSLLLVLPFIGLVDYVRLLQNLSDTFDAFSYTPYALLLDAGAPEALARIGALALGFAVLGLVVRRRSFALAIAAALLLSPIVWLHSFALLALPLAATTPVFDWAWLVPLVMIFATGSGNGAAWQTTLVLVSAAVVIVAAELGTSRRWRIEGGAAAPVPRRPDAVRS